MSDVMEKRIVEMDFDNQKFEEGVDQSLKSLDRLEKSLNKDFNSDAFEDVANNVAGCASSLQTLAGNAEYALSSFVKFEVLGTSIQKITTGILNSAESLIKGVTIDPMTTGLNEYESYIDAFQSIMAGTRKQFDLTNGALSEDDRLKNEQKQLDAITTTLDSLNEYADKTIYNFTQMTSAIGKFTSAGVRLNEATIGVKGISNLAAMAGADSASNNRAMYNIAQALSAGALTTRDWVSIENANMATKEFQDLLVMVAQKQGKKVDLTNGFRESLSDKWIDNDVLLMALKIMGNGLTEEDIGNLGLNSADIKYLKELGSSAEKAATQVKTISQLVDTLKESAQSGWTESWKLIIGDLDEAKATLTEISEHFGAIIGERANKRNSILKEWKENGGRDSIIDGLRNILTTIETIISTAKAGFRSIIPETTGKQLADISFRFKEITGKIKDVVSSKEFTAKLSSIFRAIGRISKIAKTVGSTIIRYALKIADTLSPLAEIVWNFAGFLADAFDLVSTKLGDSNSELTLFYNVLDWIKAGLKSISDFLTGTFSWALDGINSLLSGTPSKAKSFGSNFKSAFESSGVFKWLEGKINSAYEKLEKPDLNSLGKNKPIQIYYDEPSLWEKTKAIFSNIWGKVQEYLNKDPETNIFEWIWDKVTDAFNFLSKNLPVIFGWIDSIINPITSFVGDKITKFWTWLKGLFGGMNLLDLAGAFSIGSGSFGITSLIFNIGKSLANITSAFSGIKNFGKGIQEAGKGLSSIGEGIKAFSKNGIQIAKKDSVGTTLLKIAAAVGLLVASVVVLSKLEYQEVLKGIGYITLLLAELVAAALIAKKVNVKGIIGLGASVLLLAVSTKMISKLSWEDLAKGLVGITAILGELLVFSLLAKKVKTSGLISLALSILVFTVSVQKMSKLSWGDLAKGLVGIGVILGELLLYSILAKRIKAGGILLLSISMLIFGKSIKNLAEMEWDELAKGLVSLGLVLAELMAYSLLARTIKAGGILLLSVALLILVKSINSLGKMDTEVAKKGLVSLGALLAELALYSRLAGSTKSMGIVLLAAGILILVKAIGSLGEMGSQSLAKGLGALLVISFEMILLSKTLSGFRSGGILILGAGLYVIAEALKTLGGMADSSMQSAMISMAILMVELVILSKTLSGFKTVGIVLLAAGLLILSVSLKKIGNMAIENILKGMLGIIGIAITITALSKKLSGFKSAGILALSVGMLILSESITKLSDIPTIALLKSLGAIAILISVMSSFGGAFKGSVLKTIVGSLTLIVTFALTIQIFVHAMKKAMELGLNGTDMLSFSVSLSTALLGLTASIAIMSAIPTGALAAGALKLAAVVSGFGLIFTGLGALEKYLGSKEGGTGLIGLISYGGDVFASIGAAIGKFISSIASGFTSNLPQIGSDLNGFTSNIGDFCQKIKEFDSGALNGVKNLGGAIVALFADNVKTTVLGFFSSGNPIDEFGKNINGMADALLDFRDHLNGSGTRASLTSADLTTVGRASDIAKKLADTCSNLPSQTLVEKITGMTKTEYFKDNIEDLADGLVGFSDSVKGKFSGDSYTDVENASKVASSLATVLDALPLKEGSLAAWIEGTPDLTSFTTNVPLLGQGLASFASAIQNNADLKSLSSDFTNKDSNFSKAIAIANGIAGIEIPNTGGLLQAVVGWKDYTGFAVALPGFAEGVIGFATTVANWGKDGSGTSIPDQSKVDLVIQLLSPLSSFAKALGEAKFDQQDFDEMNGLKPLDAFAASLPSFGDALSQYAMFIADFIDESGEGNGPTTTDTEAAKSTISSLSSFAKALITNQGYKFANKGISPLDMFSNNIGSFGQGLKDYSFNVKGFASDTANASTAADREEAKKTFMSFADLITEIVANTNYIEANNAVRALTKFRLQWPSFGSALYEYSSKVKGFSTASTSEDRQAAFETFRDFVKLISEVNLKKRKIETFNGISSSLSEFGTNFETFAGAMTGIGTNIADISAAYNGGSGNSEQSENAKTMFTDFIGFVESINTGKSKIESFNALSESLGSFGINFSVFAGTMTQVGNDCALIISGAKSAQEMTTEMNSFALLFEDKDGFFTNIGQWFTGKDDEGWDDLIDVSKHMAEFGTYLSDFAKGVKFTIGISGLFEAALNEVKTVAAAVSKNGNVYSDLETAFQDFNWFMTDYGFASILEGIRNFYTQVNSNGWDDSNLPLLDVISKLYTAFAQLGSFSDDQFKNAETLLRTITSTLVSDINSEFVLRPVLDLKDFDAGAAHIRSVLGMTPATGIRATTSITAARSLPIANEGSNFDDSRIVAEIQNVASRIDNMESAVAQIKLVIDTGVIAGAVAPKVDSILGARWEMSGRAGAPFVIGGWNRSK